MVVANQVIREGLTDGGQLSRTDGDEGPSRMISGKAF